MQKSDDRGCDDAQVQCVTSNAPIVAALDEGTVDVVAGTRWLLARPEMAGPVRHAVRRRGRPAVAGHRGRRVRVRAQPRAARRPAAAGAALAGLAPAGRGGVSARPPPRRRRDHRRRPRALPRRHLAHAPGRLRATSPRTSTTRACAPSPDAARQRVLGDDELSGTGLRWLPVEHTGNRSASDAGGGGGGRDGRAACSGATGSIADGAERRLTAGGHPGRGAVQRPRRPRCGARCPRTSRSAPSTASRARRRRWSSTRWPRRWPRTCPAAWSSCTRATA